MRIEIPHPKRTPIPPDNIAFPNLREQNPPRIPAKIANGHQGVKVNKKLVTKAVTRPIHMEYLSKLNFDTYDPPFLKMVRDSMFAQLSRSEDVIAEKYCA